MRELKFLHKEKEVKKKNWLLFFITFKYYGF